MDSINITGGVIAAYGGVYKSSDGSCYYGAAIGAACYSGFNSINISDSTVYANAVKSYTSGTGAAGIGAGNISNSDRSGNITISDGTVYAQGGGSSCGIGYSKDISGDWGLLCCQSCQNSEVWTVLRSRCISHMYAASDLPDFWLPQ